MTALDSGSLPWSRESCGGVDQVPPFPTSFLRLGRTGWAVSSCSVVLCGTVLFGISENLGKRERRQAEGNMEQNEAHNEWGNKMGFMCFRPWTLLVQK